MTKACGLKGQQKVFLLHLNQVASCCRAKAIPLNHQSINHYLDLWNSESNQLTQGVEISGCEHCWNAERLGQRSYRQEPIIGNSNYVEIHIDNLCNQMCGYCSPKFSSAWENNIQQFGNFDNVSKSAKENLLPNVSNNSNVDYWINELKDFLSRGPVAVKLLGGEPLMQRRNLQQLLELNTDQITVLKINTNLNPPNNKFLKWVLETFPKEKLAFEISLDTVPEYNAIPRAGFDSSRFEENLSLLAQYNVMFSFLSVVSVLNIFSINKYQVWLNKHGYQTKFCQLHNPDCLSPYYLPDQFKQSILKNPLPDNVINILSHSPKSVDLKLFEQYNYLKQYFQRTNTKITDPDLMRYWSWLEGKFK